MKTWAHILLCSIVVSYASMWAAAAPQTDKEKKASDLTGRWRLVVTFDRGGGTSGTLRLTQQGTKLTGTFTRNDIDSTVTGALNGKSLTSPS
jgi:hypothetical protein